MFCVSCCLLPCYQIIMMVYIPQGLLGPSKGNDIQLYSALEGQIDEVCPVGDPTSERELQGEDSPRALPLKVWPTDQQHQHHFGNLSQMQNLRPHPRSIESPFYQGL